MGMTDHPEDLRPVPETPLRYHRGRLQQQHVVTRYKPNGRQDSQTVEWRDVEGQS
jgi:hypothetical protein